MGLTHIKCPTGWQSAGVTDPKAQCRNCPHQTDGCYDWRVVKAVYDMMVRPAPKKITSMGVTSCVKGACLRAAALKKMYNYGEEPQKLMAAFYGTAAHHFVEVANDPKEVEVKLSADIGDGWVLRGIADVCDEYVADWKAGSVHKRLRDAYRHQVMCYMAMSGVYAPGRVVYLTKPGLTHVIDASKEECDEVPTPARPVETQSPAKEAQPDKSILKERSWLWKMGSAVGSVASSANTPALWTGLAAMLGFGGPIGLGIGVAGWIISKRLHRS